MLALRLVFMQVVMHSSMEELARRQYDLVIKLPSVRGTIYDINMKELAFSVNLESLYANPRLIKDPKEAAKKLAGILEESEEFFYDRLTRDKSFVWLSRRLAPQKALEVKKLDMEHIGFIKEPKRFYPGGDFASHVIGFSGLDNTGLEGIELGYDKYLRGKAGVRFTKRDAKHRQLPFYKDRFIPPADGFDLVLTIDSFIQSLVESELDGAMEKFTAVAATIIIMEPSTGKVLALGNRPSFDPNDFHNFEAEARRNRAITDAFEPGSVFKVVAATAALQEAGLGLEDKFYCEKGAYKVSRSYTLHDYRPHGWLTLREVFENSSNIGTGKVSQIVGRGNLYNTINAYGFGSITGIDLDGEVSGLVSRPSEWSISSLWNIPMGQGVAVTALQLACGISAVANDGVMMKPYLVDHIKDKNSRAIKAFKPQPIRRVSDRNTARQLKEILSGVVKNGTGKNAGINGVTAAGKTGTAQKVKPGGGYSNDRYISSFIGFCPAEEPRLSCVVIVDEPKPQHFGSIVSAPVFSRIMSQALDYLDAKKAQAQEPAVR